MINLNGTVITVLILIVGFILLLTTARRKKIETGFAANFVTVGFALITDSFGTFSGDMFAFLSGESTSTNKLQLITGGFLVLIGVRMSFYVKNKLSILNLVGFRERRIDEHRENLGLNQFEYKEREVDLRNFGVSLTDKEFKNTTDLIKEKVESFCAENKGVNRGYTGTAPIPFTLYAGSCYKGAATTDYFEYRRSDSTFYKLQKVKKHWYSREKRYPSLELKQPLPSMDLTTSGEVVLGVSLTMEVTAEQVSQFNSPFVHLSIPDPTQNVIEYREQLQNYTNKVFDMLVEISGMPGINKIHLVMSSQSCLAYELGKQLSTTTYMAEIVNYQFVTGHNPKYPWGISFSHEGVNYIQC